MIVPVEQLRPGMDVLVSRRIGWRRVVDVRRYDTHGLERVECFVVLYQPAGPGVAWENRATAKGVVSTFPRTEAALAPRRAGELVEARRAA